MKKMKKLLSVILSIILIVSIIPIGAGTVSAETITHLLDYLEYEFQDNQVIITDCNESIKGSIELPDNIEGYPVTEIDEYAFYNCYRLTDVKIPDSVKNIDKSAFASCTGLINVILPNSITSISNKTFSGCSALTSITIPNNVTTIGDYAFSGCSNLTGITIPDNVKSLGDSVFSYCEKLKNVTIGNNITSINEYTFYDCHSLTDVIIGDSVTSISDTAFSGTEIYTNSDNWENGVLYIDNHLIDAQYTLSGNYSIKNGTKSIADNAFEWCSDLTGISIPNSVKSIGNEAFYHCESLNTITIPESVMRVGASAFHNTKLYNDSNNWEDDVLYIGNHLIEANEMLFGDYSIKDGTKIICDSAFAYKYNLKKVILPDSVINIGYNAFNTCENLTDIYYKGSIDEAKKIELGDYNDVLYCTIWHYNTCSTHSYSGTCDTKCNNCDWTRNVNSTHTYNSATCTKPKTCKICNYTSGSALGHDYEKASCINPKTCKRCDKTSGSKLKHDYEMYKVKKATTSADGKKYYKCEDCGATKTTTIEKIKKVKLSTTEYTYSSKKTRKPSVTVYDSNGDKISSKYYKVEYASGRKNVGKYKVTVTFKGKYYEGKKTAYFEILPKETKVSKLTANKKSLKVSIKKQTSQTTGYQIQYSTSKKFTSAKTKTTSKTSYTIKSLKAKKTYYIRVRTYKTVDGKKYYSKWSSYKSKKTK